ncbi:unnamed protein product [Rotaria magnacalcarata]|uniref:Bromodomain adjacent to zinc finger domain protein 2B n=3 Tax=Rotaria magnacalcarata TaxID=392030 RepID=A0A819LZT3_9BILA|nr:unnamed protein product [Rotaria magnacalcarata]CAF3971150.1 unnamed protein product [Rotaria magnacalcarata]
MSNSKETMTKKQQDDLASTFNNLPWGSPLGFSSMSSFGAFPPFGLPTPNFSSLNSFTSSAATGFPSPSPLLPNNPMNSPTTDLWSNGLSTANMNVDYNEYAKQLGFLMNAFSKQPEIEKSKTTQKVKSSKSINPISNSSQVSSTDTNPNKKSTSKTIDESHTRPTSTSSSSTSSRRSSSNNLNKSSRSSKSKPNTNSSSTSAAAKISSNNNNNNNNNNTSAMLDPLAFAAANVGATGGYTFPYFLPSLLSQTASTSSSTAAGTNNNSSLNSTTAYPFSSLSSSLMNPATTFYPFLSPDWFTSPTKFMDTFNNLPSDKTTDSKESTSHQTSKSKQSQKNVSSENKHSSSVNPILNESSSKSKKRAKSIRALTEEQELNQEKSSSKNQSQKTSSTNPSLLHSALMKSSHDVLASSSITSFSSSIDSTFKPVLFENSFYKQPSHDLWAFKPIKETTVDDSDPSHTNDLHDSLLNLSRRSSINETASNRQTPNTQSADESRSNDDDDSDPNPKRRKGEEVSETLIRIPLNRGWKRVTIVRAITRTGVRGDVSYYAPCGRKLRSFQEIDRYLTKKKITDLDRSHFTFSSKVHIGHFHEPKEGLDGKIIFSESTEDEIVNRILEINPKFRRIRYEYENETPTKSSTISSPSVTPSHNNGINDHHQPQDLFQQIYEENRKLRLEQEEIAKRAAEIKTNREAMRLLRNISGESSKNSDRLPNPSYPHNDFLKAIMEQQKLIQQQELEHQQKLQQEQQEQERKRQELAYLKQLEFKKRQEEKLFVIEQRKAEKNAQREKKIQEKYMEIVLAREMKRITEDMQIRDLKPLPILKPVENMRLSIEAFANSLMIIQFLNNFKDVFHIPDNLILTLNSFQQSSSSSSREINSLCQMLLSIALEDPGIPNPKKGLTNLGQKLSEIDITEHTFSEILRLYIRERNGFDDKVTQNLSDTSFQSLSIDEKLEILAFLCNDLSANKRTVEDVDRNLDEVTVLKHEKLEIEKRLRRLKFEKSNQPNSNNVKKLATLIREKDLNSSDNESPDESDTEITKIEDETAVTNDPAAVTADDEDIETIDESKIDDLDKRLTLITRKYALIKRRVIDKHSRTRALHLGQDRYRRRYWYFSHLPGIYIEGLTSGDISPNDIKNIVVHATKQKLDKTGESSTPSRSTQRKKQQTKTTNQIPSSPPSVVNSTEQLISDESNKIKNETIDNDEEQQQQQQQPDPEQINASNNETEDLATMDLTAFCLAANREHNAETPLVNENENDNQSMIIKAEPSEDLNNNNNNKRDLNEMNNDAGGDLPLDLSCSKVKRSCEEDYRSSQHTQAAYPLLSSINRYDKFQELDSLATTAVLLNNIKQENIVPTNILNLANSNSTITSCNLSTSIKQELPTNNFKHVEQSIREKFQYSQPLPIPDDVQSGWWHIQTADELRNLIKCLSKRGQRERYLCRMLQRYFDLIINSMKPLLQSNGTTETSSPSTENKIETENDEQQQLQQSSSNDLIEPNDSNSDDTHEMDVLNEIYNLLDRIIASGLHCRSLDTNISRKRLTHLDIQAKGSDILDEAKHLLTEIERNIERRYLKHPFVRRYEINVSPLNRINQNSTYHHTSEDSTNEIVSSSKYDEAPQQLERWRRTVNESRTPAQLALCLTQLERCIAWERSIMRVYCEICNSDDNEEKLLLCDGCDHGTHTFCFLPPMSFIPPNDWYCYVCIGKAKGENLCFVCGNKSDNQLNRCEHCGKLFHEHCLKNAKQQRGKWLCVLCAANDTSSFSNGNSTATTTPTTTPTKCLTGRQTSRSLNSRQPTNNSTVTNTNGDSTTQSSSSTTNTNRNRSNTNNNRKSKSNNTEIVTLQESHSNSSHPDTPLVSVLHDSSSNDMDDDIASPLMSNASNNNNNNNNSKKKSSKRSKPNNDVKACRIILNELLKSDVSWPFQTPVDAKQHPEYYECIKNPMDFATIKKKMRNNQYTKRDEFLNDVELLLNNCEYFNEDDSPVGQAGHLLRTFFQAQWAKQFG